MKPRINETTKKFPRTASNYNPNWIECPPHKPLWRTLLRTVALLAAIIAVIMLGLVWIAPK
jgi:hypothetical protein